ncbi:MAG: hypothetical protein H6Q18_510 [Bacteroidetes bacterium]|nr:hypothetical protein [Bacteroidota bacterium]
MRKISTPLHSTKRTISKNVSMTSMNPSETTVDKILQFAASYRVEKISKNEFVEYYLN